MAARVSAVHLPPTCTSLLTHQTTIFWRYGACTCVKSDRSVIVNLFPCRSPSLSWSVPYLSTRDMQPRSPLYARVVLVALLKVAQSHAAQPLVERGKPAAFNAIRSNALHGHGAPVLGASIREPTWAHTNQPARVQGKPWSQEPWTRLRTQVFSPAG